MSAETLDSPTLLSRWNNLKTAEPQLKIRDAASRLNTTEASLLSLLLGSSVRRLRCEPADLLPRLEPFGPLMALTRNDGAVHERHGVYSNLSIQGNVGLINNADIDLRLDFSVWSLAFAEVKNHAGRTLRSLQFFDASGTAVHKIYLEEDGHAAAWESLVVEFLHDDQTGPFAGEGERRTSTQESELDTASANALVEAWESLKDPHYFHGLLRKHRATRHQAFCAAEGRFTRRVSVNALRTLLPQASAQAVPLMVFVGNPGCVQIHTGTVGKILNMGSWVNVMDPEFNLHVDLSQAAEAWVVTKPSPDGPVSSLEYLSAQGELLVQLFGKRKPGIPELASWKLLLEAL